jgi:hypothetical protein
MSEQPDAGLVGKLAEKKIDDEVLAAIKERWHGPGDPFSNAPQAKIRFLPRLMAAKTGHKAKRYEDVMNRLLVSGAVVNSRKRRDMYGLCAVEDLPNQGNK